MEFVEGRTLRQVIPRGGMTCDDFLRIATELTRAVTAAHTAGITHRDLKPDNVMITQSGGVKVLDFGLAKVIDEPRDRIVDGQSTVKISPPEAERLTRDDKLIGTIPYISPEHVTGRDIDTRSDLFSLAIILHEMLTGERPFQGRSPTATMASILYDQPRPISSDRHDVPEHLQIMIALCLEKDPAKRLQSAEGLSEQLRVLRLQYSSGASLTGENTSRRHTGAGTITGGIVSRFTGILARHRLPSLLLVIVFSINLIETMMETALRARYGFGLELELQLARAAHWFEGSGFIQRRGIRHHRWWSMAIPSPTSSGSSRW